MSTGRHGRLSRLGIASKTGAVFVESASSGWVVSFRDEDLCINEGLHSSSAVMSGPVVSYVVSFGEICSLVAFSVAISEGYVEGI